MLHEVSRWNKYSICGQIHKEQIKVNDIHILKKKIQTLKKELKIYFLTGKKSNYFITYT